MENRIHLYISRKNIFTWLMTICLVYSAVARVVVFGFTKNAGTVGFWGQLMLPTAATILYLVIVWLDGTECYSRGEDIQFCLTIKKEMSTDSPDTVIKVHLSPRDTAADVYHKLNGEIEKAKNTPLDSGFDNTAHALMLMPGVCLKFVVWCLKTLDYFGLLPQFLLEVSPFHGSISFTSMGSLGIPPIYHHLYDFGNLPIFGSFGCKRKAYEIMEDGTVAERKYVDFKFTMDERIADGYYYATFFKHFKRVIARPEVLNTPPEEVNADIG